MQKKATICLISLMLGLLTCSKYANAADSKSAAAAPPPSNAVETSNAGAAAKPDAGLLAEPSGIKGTLAVTIKWSATIVTGFAAEGLTTSVYNRTAQLKCPITSSNEASYSYFAVVDNPNSDPFASTGSYQPWWNEECTGSLTLNDTYHADDPTLMGPEPVVKTTGTRPLETSDTPLTVETDLSRARTRYLFIAPSTKGFQQEAAEGYPAKLVEASAAPMATIDCTLKGPIGDGKHEVPVQGGTVWVEWTFTRGRDRP